MYGIKQKFKCSCVLACIESLIRDQGGKTSSQADLIEQNPEYCDQSEEGAGCVNFENISPLLRKLGFRVTEPTGDISIQKGTEYLIASSNGGFHCFRFRGESRDGKWILMDPMQVTEDGDQTDRLVSQDEFQAMNPVIYEITGRAR